jgi:WD40 repeat protein/predicted Ser/Thr protein kinase
MRIPATDTVVEPSAAAESADDLLAEQELLSDPKVAACLDRLAARWPQPQLQLPAPVWQKLGRFEIRRELGRGRFGVVFLAWDPQLQRQVALKVPQFDTAVDPELRERFRGEALSAGKLQHAGIVPIYEVGQHAGVDYLAMAYIEGVTLAERLQTGPLPPADAARLLIGLALAIQHAHEQGVIHRDLKPSNVLLDKQEQPHVGDFGLARRLSDSAMRATATGQVLGTPAYMPPEQATGETNIGPASDIYSLGVILYESLTGRPPFQAATFVEAVEFILNRDPLPPSKLNPKLAKELDAITFKCLEKKESARYTSAADLADDLQLYLDGRPIRARVQGPVQQAFRWARKNPSYTLLLVTALVVVGLLLTTAGIYDRWQHADELAQQQSKIADQQRQNAAAQEQIAKTQSQIAATERYFATVNRARNLTTRRLPGWSQSARAEIRAAAAAQSSAADPLELRALAAEALTGFDLQEIGTANAGMQIGRIAISHDGNLLAVGELKGSASCRVVAYDLATRQPKHRFTIVNVATNVSRIFSGEAKWQEGVREFAFSSDDRYLAVGMRFGNVYCFDLQAPAQPPRHLTVSKERELDQLAFSADGQTLFALTKDDEFIRWQDWRTGASFDSPWSTHPRSFAVAPQGHQLFVQQYAPGTFLALDQELRKREYFSPAAQMPRAIETQLVTDSQGNLLAGKSDQGIRMYETKGGYLVRRLQDDTLVDDNLGAALAMTADGQVLSAFDTDGIVRLFDVSRGKQVLRVDLGRHELQDVALDPQGQWLVVANDDTLQFHRLHQPVIRKVVTSPADEVQDLRFSPDGVLACATKTGGLGGPLELSLLTFTPAGSLAQRRSAGFEHSTLSAGESQVAWTPDGRQFLWCGKFGARVVGEDATSRDRLLPLLGEILPVEWEAVAAVEGESIEFKQIPHPRDPQRQIWQIIPHAHDCKLKCRLPRLVKPVNHIPTLSISLRIDADPAASGPLQLHQRFGDRQFPPIGAPAWAVSSRSGDFQQWSVELPESQEFTEFQLLITNAAAVRSIEIESLNYVALARQFEPASTRRILQQLDFLSISPQGERVWGCIDEQVCSWSLATGERLATWRNPQHALSKAGYVRCLQAGSQGTIVGTRDGGVYWLDPERGTTQAVWSGPGKEAVAIALCEAAGFVLVAGDKGKVRGLHLPSGRTLVDLAADDSAVIALAATPDGQTLVTASTNRTLKLWRLKKADGQPTGYELFCQLPDTITPAKAVALSADGNRLAILSSLIGSVELWNLPALTAELQRLGIE